MAKRKPPPEKNRKGHEKPVSLHPVSFPEAVSDLLKVKPPPKTKKGSKLKRKPASRG
jgi:hypothetical protein